MTPFAASKHEVQGAPGVGHGGKPSHPVPTLFFGLVVGFPFNPLKVSYVFLAGDHFGQPSSFCRFLGVKVSKLVFGVSS